MLTFDKLYKSYSIDVYRFACWLTGDSKEAEDITSETFIRAWTSSAEIRTETLKAYLLMITRNTFLEWQRKRRKETELFDNQRDPNPGPDRITEIREELRETQKIIRSLPECDRAAFILRVENELPYAEIARILQISLSSAKVKVHRTRKKILLSLQNEEEHKQWK